MLAPSLASDASPSGSTAFPFSWAHCFGPPVFVFCKESDQTHMRGSSLETTFTVVKAEHTLTSGLAVGDGF